MMQGKKLASLIIASLNEMAAKLHYKENIELSRQGREKVFFIKQDLITNRLNDFQATSSKTICVELTFSIK